MGYKLNLDHPARSLKATAREQLTDAEDVHDARKRLKKTRALLRLARPAMPDTTFRVKNARLRDRGRQLSGARDAEAMLETLDYLAEHNTRRVRIAHLLALRDRFPIPEDPPDHQLDPHEPDAWPLDDLTPRTLVKGLTRTYRRGRAAYRQAAADPTTERLHEWRKRVKDLWYQQRLLKQAWPEVMTAQASEAKALSKLLGTDHDLAVLDAELKPQDPLHGVIADNRERLQHEAFALGERVFAESPKAFRKRLRRYVRAVA
jgi:CHAD domain-containing protein